MPFTDELDQFMRSGLEELAPKAPADLPDLVEARLATRKRHRVVVRVTVAVAAAATVVAVASLTHTVTRQRAHVEHPPSQTSLPPANGRTPAPNGGNGSAAHGVVGASGADGQSTNSGSAAAPGGASPQPGNASSTPGTTHGGGGGGENNPPTPPADNLPHLTVTRMDGELVPSSSSVPTGLIDITYVDTRGTGSTSVLQVHNGVSIAVAAGQTVQVRTGDYASMSITSLDGNNQMEPGNTLVRVLPPYIAPPSEPVNELTVEIRAGGLALPMRQIVTYLKMPYTTIVGGEMTIHVRNDSNFDGEIRIGGINSKWRVRPGHEHDFSFRITLNGGTGTTFLLHADPTSGAPEQVLLGIR